MTFFKRYIFLIFVVVAFTATFSYAQSGDKGDYYFCNRKGTTLEYCRKYTDGRVKWVHKMRILDVSAQGVISYSSEFLNKRAKPKFGAPFQMKARLRDGSVEIDVAKAMASVISGVSGGVFEVSSSGDKTLLPSDLQVGDSLPNASCQVKMAGMTLKVQVDERVVLKRETLITEAGKFNCIVVQELKIEKGMGRNRETTALTWYAKGYGMIRHDTYKSGKLDTSEILVKIY